AGPGGAALGDAPGWRAVVRDQSRAGRAASQATGPADRGGAERPGGSASGLGEAPGSVGALAPAWSAEEGPQHAATAVRTQDCVCTKDRSGLTSFAWGPYPLLRGFCTEGSGLGWLRSPENPERQETNRLTVTWRLARDSRHS